MRLTLAAMLLALSFASSGCLLWGKKYHGSGYVSTFSSVVKDSEECFTVYGIEFRRDKNLEACPPESKIKSLVDLFLIEHKLRKETLSRVEVTFTADAVTCGSFTGAFEGCVQRNFVVVRLQGRIGTWSGWDNTLCYELGKIVSGPPFTLYTDDLSEDLKAWAKKFNEKSIRQKVQRERQGRFKYGCMSRESIEGSVKDGGYWPKGVGW